MPVARLVIVLSTLLAPRRDRARLREEWLAELGVAEMRGRAAAWRFALGAPAGAWSMRSSSGRSPVGLFSALGGDIRYAARQLLARPAHTLAVIACLVVGLVVSIGTFSVLQSLMVGDRPGVRDARAMRRLYLRYTSADGVAGQPRHHVSSDELSSREFALTGSRDLPPASVFSALGVEGRAAVTVIGNHGAVATIGVFASGDFFKVLNTERGAAGRLIDASDDQPDAPAVAVVSDHFWRVHLDAQPDAIGRPIVITGMSFTVIGVAPPRFHGLEWLDPGEDDSHGAQVWIPLAMASRWSTLPSPDEPWLTPVARLKSGASPTEAERELAIASARIAAAAPADRADASLRLRSQFFGPDVTPAEILGAVMLIMLLPLTVLGIGCANVANLQLARAAERSRELAVRLALGASRIQLIRLLTFETLARALTAVALALVLLRVVMRYFQPFFPIYLRIDVGVALFAIALALSVALGTGLVPAWLVLRRTAAGQLKQSAQSGGVGHSRLRTSLVVVQVALSLALLTTATLIVQTTRQMTTSAPAVLREQVVASFNPDATGMTPAEGRRFADTLAERAASDSRARGVALSWTTSVDLGDPQQVENGSIRQQRADVVGITPSWLDVMDVPLLTGRRLTTTDDEHVALLSARAAEVIAPDASAVGEVVTLRWRNQAPRQVRIVGVVADNPTRPGLSRPIPVVYTVLPETLPGEFVLRIRSRDPEALGADLPKLVTSVDPRIAWTSVRRGDMRFQDAAKEASTLGLAVSAAGSVALVLSVTGLFAVMSYTVMLRRREIGVRIAIGADPWRIVGLVMRQGLTLVSVGAAVGLAIAIPVAFLMRAEVTASIKPMDPVIFVPAVALLFFAGGVAAFVPALRASRVDPIATLRQD